MDNISVGVCMDNISVDVCIDNISVHVCLDNTILLARTRAWMNSEGSHAS